MARVHYIKAGRTPTLNGEPMYENIVKIQDIPEGYEVVPEQLTTVMELIVEVAIEEAWEPERLWKMLLDNVPKYILVG